jgi:hypothetical protein
VINPGLGHPARRTRRGLAGLAVALALAAAVAACGGAGNQNALNAQAPVAAGQASTGPDLAGVQLPDFQMPLIDGGVSLPNIRLTPGAVATTNANVVCSLPKHGDGVGMPAAEQTAVYDAYGYVAVSQQRKYILDDLVPLDLGGAQVQSNVWPAALRGTGFYEKVQTDHILRDLVCRRLISLPQAQRALERDWYTAWLTYVVGAGHV